jgi:hypothetical protein
MDEIMVELAEKGMTCHDINKFRLERLRRPEGRRPT